MSKVRNLNPYDMEERIHNLEENGGGGSYVLPTATTESLGGVKIGSGINITEDGTISANGSSATQKAYGTAVDLSATTEAAPFTCPSDGVVNLQSGYASANYTALIKVGWTGYMAVAKGNESQASGAMTVPVLKGDVLYTATAGTGTVANYYPYVDAVEPEPET